MFFSTALVIAFAGIVTASPTPEILEKRAVSCLTVGATATARWTNSAGKTCTWTGSLVATLDPTRLEAESKLDNPLAFCQID